MMFENFTEKAIKVIMLAQEESRRSGHNFVGTEQLFLGLVGQASGVASRVLRDLGLTLRESRGRVDQLIGRGSGFVSPEVPFTSKAKKSLERAHEASKQLGQSYIDTQHLLLGVLKDEEEDGILDKLLTSFGLERNKIKADLMKKLNQEQFVAAAATSTQDDSHNNTPVSTTDLSSSSSSPSKFTIGAVAAADSGYGYLREYSIDLTEKAKKGELDPVVGRLEEIDRLVQILSRRTKSNPVLIGEPGVGKTAIAEGVAQRIVEGDVPIGLEGKRLCVLDIGMMVAGTKYRGEFEDRVKKVLEDVRRHGNVILFIDEIHTIIGAGAGEGALDAANLLKPALARSEFQCIGATTLEEYKKHFERDSALERRFQPIQIREPDVSATLRILRTLAPKYEAFHHVKYSNDALLAAAKFSEQYIADRHLPDKAIDLADEAAATVKIRHTKRPPKDREIVRKLNAAYRDLERATADDKYEQVTTLQDQLAKMEEQLAGSEHTAKAANTVPLVEAEHVAEVVSSWTGIPLAKLTADESSRLMEMEKALHRRLIGQNSAVTAVSRAVRRSKAGLKHPNRPIASFLFCGPTGVGKSELAKALGSYLFDSADPLVRLDMTEYMERFSVSKLIGSPPGYVGYEEGGQLTEAVRRKPYAVILFDEVEKAHPDVFNLLLQILEDGRLTDGKGRTVDFKNALLILTSNIGSKVIERAAAGAGALGFDTLADEEAAHEGGKGTTASTGEDDPGKASETRTAEDASRYRRIKTLVQEELKSFFRPEFLNRLDEVVVFEQLRKAEVEQIASLLVDEVCSRCLDQRNLQLVVTARLLGRIVQEGFDPVYGARPLRRAVIRLLEDNLADALLSGTIFNGDKVIADLDNRGNVRIVRHLKFSKEYIENNSAASDSKESDLSSKPPPPSAPPPSPSFGAGAPSTVLPTSNLPSLSPVTDSSNSELNSGKACVSLESCTRQQNVLYPT